VVSHSAGCQRVTASVTTSLPSIRRSVLPIGQASPIGWNCSGTAMCCAQLVALSGEDVSSSPPVAGSLRPSTSLSPRGTITSQHGRPVLRPDVSVLASPQPSPGASRPVWTSANTWPVPSGRVRPYPISLVELMSKNSLAPRSVTTFPVADLNGT
jgi:hypothetical protein